MTLTDFLLARIAEAEAMAHRVLPAVEGGGEIQISLYTKETLPDGTERTYTDCVVPYDPARVLAECEAKRQIVEIHGTYHECSTGHLHGIGLERDPGAADELCPTIRALALPYADHPDYRPEWRP